MQIVGCYKRIRNHAGLRILALIVILSVLATGFGFGQRMSAAPPVKKVLIMYSHNPELPFYTYFTSSLKNNC